MTPEEVRLVMNGWFERRSQLVLIGALVGFSVFSHCEVTLVADGHVELGTKDEGRFSVVFGIPGSEVRYLEPREFKEHVSEMTVEQGSASFLLIMLPPRDGAALTEREHVVLGEYVN